MKLLTLSAAAALMLASNTFAQSFNIDIGVGTAPAATFGAAALQPGVWGTIGNVIPGSSIPLVDITGAATGATISSVFGGSNGPFTSNDPSTLGDDAALLDDYLRVTAVTGEQFQISGLPTSATYHVYVYAWSPNFPTDITRVTIGNGGPASQVGGAWTGAYAMGVTHAGQTTVTTGPNGAIFIGISPAPAGFAAINGIQLVRAPTTASPFCAATSSPIQNCPSCGFSVVGNGSGCPNSLSSSGAGLAWSGNPGASLATDSLRLIAQGVTGPCLFFQSDALGPQAVFGEGVLCASVGLRRLEVVIPAGIYAVLPAGAGSPPIHLQGQVSAGDTKHYQCWYRDSAAFCTAATFNVTSGWSLTWLP